MTIPGTRIADRYVLEELLNDSELVEVWRATRIDQDDPVLLKLLAKEYSEQPEAVTRFEQQYETLRELGGRHVVVPIDIGQCPDGRLYLVTEFLEGQTLKERFEARGPLPAKEVVDFVAQACLGLQDAHVRNIVHRDLKPSNLFLISSPWGSDADPHPVRSESVRGPGPNPLRAPPGAPTPAGSSDFLPGGAEGKPTVKLIDFEMAKTRDVKITREGQAIGSAMYMPPEQMRSAGAVSPSADVWALGVTMYYLTSGKHPFEGKSVTALAMSIMNDDPVPLGSRNPRLPKEFVEVVHRCLSRKASDRYGTGGQLRQALLGLSMPKAAVEPSPPRDAPALEVPRDPEFDQWLHGAPSNPFRPPRGSEAPEVPALAGRAHAPAAVGAEALGNAARSGRQPGATGWTFWAFALPIAGALLLGIVFWWFIL